MTNFDQSISEIDENGIRFVKTFRIGYSLWYETQDMPGVLHELVPYSDNSLPTQTYRVDDKIIYTAFVRDEGSSYGDYFIVFSLSSDGPEKLVEVRFFAQENTIKWFREVPDTLKQKIMNLPSSLPLAVLGCRDISS